MRYRIESIVSEGGPHIHVVIHAPWLVQKLPWPRGFEQRISEAIDPNRPWGVSWSMANGGAVPNPAVPREWFRWVAQTRRKLGTELSIAQSDAHSFVLEQRRVDERLAAFDDREFGRRKVHIFLSIPKHTLVDLGSGPAGYSRMCSAPELCRLNISMQAFALPSERRRHGRTLLHPWQLLWALDEFDTAYRIAA